MSRLTRWGFDRASGARARPVPLVRRAAFEIGPPRAAPATFPYPHGTLAELAELAEEAARPFAIVAEAVEKSGAVVLPDPDHPAPTRELAARACHAPQPREGRPVVNVAEQDGPRRELATVPASAPDPLPAPPRHPPPSPVRQLVSKVAAELDAEAEDAPIGERDANACPPRDASRFVAAHRAKDRAREPVRPIEARPLPLALSREECRRCGIPGWKGCEHQAPFVPEPPPPRRSAEREPHGHGTHL